MKRIIVTTIATLLLCSGSAAFARSATAPQQPQATQNQILNNMPQAQ